MKKYQSKNAKYIKDKLKKVKSILQNKYKVKKIGIFGSFVNGTITKKSDVDILVEFKEPIGWEFIDCKEYLENILKRKVDLVTINALKPQMKNTILNQVVYA